jgi:hypothetical protein
MASTTLSFHNNGYRIPLTLLLACLLAFGSYTAQALDLEWAKRGGGTGYNESYSLAVDSVGNTYVTGYFTEAATFGFGEAGEITVTNEGDTDIFIAKYATDGNLVWAKRAGGTYPDSGFLIPDSGNSVVVDSSDNVYVAGVFAESATFGAGETGETILTSERFVGGFIAKYTADGNLIWAKRPGSQGVARPNDLAVDGLGNVYVTGLFSSVTFGAGEASETILTSNGHNNTDMFIAKYTASGNLVWAKNAGDTTAGGGETKGVRIDVDGSGNAYVMGLFDGSPTFGFGEAGETSISVRQGLSQNGFMVKYTVDGDLVWVKTISQLTKDIAVNNAGDIYTTGHIDDLVARYTTNGDLVWTRHAEFVLEGEGGVENSGSSVAVDNSGNVYVTDAFTKSTTFGPEQVSETKLTSDGARDIFVAKYSANGDLILAKRAGGGSIDISRDLAIDNSGNVYVTGSFGSHIPVFSVDPLTFDPLTFSHKMTTTFGLGENRETTLSSNGVGVRDIFVAKLSDAALFNPPVIIEAQIEANSDDAEEIIVSGTVNLGSRDLEMAEKNNKGRLVGMRFNGLNIPKDATITQAYLQFQVNDLNSERADLTITGQATANAPTFTAANTNISSRIKTGAVAAWTPEPWNTIGEAGSDQKTPNIAPVIQEIINQAGWLSGNSLAIIVSGSGMRSADSFDGDPAAAPLLHVEYTLEAGTSLNPPLAVDAGPDQTIGLPNSAFLDGTINNNSLPIPPEVTTTWSQVSGPGTVTFADPNAIDTTASFDFAGTYVVKLTIDDGNHSDFNQLMVKVVNQALNWDWAKRVRGPGFNQDGTGADLVVDGSGNSYITGEFKNTSVFGGGEAGETTLTSDGDNDIFLAKYAVNGDLVWVKRAGGTFDDRGRSLALDSSGNVYVTGVFQGSVIFGSGETGETTLTTSGGSDIFVAKYTADGNLIWVTRAGGTDSDQGNSLGVDGSGNAYLTGNFRGIAIFGPGEISETTLTSAGDSDIFVAKYTAVGDLVWANRAGSTGSDFGKGLAMDSSGNAYVTGDFGEPATFEDDGEEAIFGAGEAGETILSNKGYSDIFVAKYTADGNLVWAKRAGSTSFDRSRGIAVSKSGNVYITGSGQIETSQGGADEIVSHPNSHPLFVAKYSASGNQIWVTKGSSNLSGSSLVVNNSGNVHVTGTLFGTYAIFRSGQGVVFRGLPGGNDIAHNFVAKYSASSGYFISAKYAGRRGRTKRFDRSANGIAVDDSGNIYVTGNYSSTSTLRNEGRGEIIVESDGPSSIFVAKLVNASAVIDPIIVESRVTASTDDAEENIVTGKVNLNSSDLDLVEPGTNNQLVGLRFNSLAIPRSAMISNAYIQFQTDETHSSITRLKIWGVNEDIGSTPTFTNTNANISSGFETFNEVDWRPAPWTTIGEAGPNQQTPDISSIIQEIVSEREWASGNSLIIRISGNTGTRTAVSYDGNPAAAPLLHVEYQ